MASSLTASALAIADAGIEMYDLLIGAELLCIPKQKDENAFYLLDPNADEERSSLNLEVDFGS